MKHVPRDVSLNCSIELETDGTKLLFRVPLPLPPRNSIFIHLIRTTGYNSLIVIEFSTENPETLSGIDLTFVSNSRGGLSGGRGNLKRGRVRGFLFSVRKKLEGIKIFSLWIIRD